MKNISLYVNENNGINNLEKIVRASKITSYCFFKRGEKIKLVLKLLFLFFSAVCPLGYDRLCREFFTSPKKPGIIIHLPSQNTR